MKPVLFGLATVAMLAVVSGTASAQVVVSPATPPATVVPTYQAPLTVGGTIVTTPSVVVPPLVAPPVVVSPVLPVVRFGYPYYYGYGRPYYYPHYYRRW